MLLNHAARDIRCYSVKLHCIVKQCLCHRNIRLASAAAVSICQYSLQSLTAVHQFAVTAKEQCEVLEGMHKKMIASYQQMAKYFCFDPKKYTVDEFFGDIKTFIDGFVVRSLSLLLNEK